MSALENYTLISGACVWPAAREEQVAYNPKLSTAPVFYQEPLKPNLEIEAATFSERDFDEYAEKLQEAGKTIQCIRPDVIIVPMRGGVRPWEHLRIYCNISPKQSVLIPFTGDEKHSDEPKQILVQALKQFENKEKVAIVVIDAAEGGQGSKRLLEILEELKNYHQAVSWEITMCLFVPKNAKHEAWQYEHEKRSKALFDVKVKLFSVSNVIGEDVDGAMIARENFDVAQRIKIESGNQIYLVETSTLPAVLDQRIAEATHQLHLTDPFCEVIDISLWRPKN